MTTPIKANWVTNDQYTAADQNAVAARVNQHTTQIGDLQNAVATGSGGTGGGGGGGGDVTTVGTQTLTNKTMSGAQNTFLNISADSVIDGALNHVFTAADDAKLASITPGATPGGTPLTKNAEGFYVPTEIPDVVGGGGGVITPVSPVSITGARIVDYGFNQSNFGHESWAGFGETTLREVLAGMKLMGAKRLRLAAWWGRFETARNVFDWDGLDRAMNLCAEYGIIPLVVITGGGQSPTYSTPTINDFANACGALAARYGAEGTGQLSHYEIWNEPYHSPTFYNPFNANFGAAHYTSLLIAAATEIRNADSEAFILSAGLMSTADFSTTDIAPHTFLAGIYANGGKNYFDACSHHWYSHTPDFATWQEPSDTQYFYTEMLTTRQVMVTNGDVDKHMWVTELGFSRTTLPDAAQRADWLAKQIELITQHDWASPFFIYNYREDGSDSSNFEYTFGVTDFSGQEYQPYFDTAASINSTVKKGVAGFTSGGGTTPAPSSGGADVIALGTQMQKEKDYYPMPGALPAPMTTDGGIASGLPSPLTGLRFVAWNNPNSFNYQGNYMQAAPAGIITAAGMSCAGNNSTPRLYDFGTYTGSYLPSTLNVRFATDSKRVIPVWYNFSGYSGINYTDQHMLVEHEGEMKHLSSGSTQDGLPRFVNTGTGIKRRELTYNQLRWRRHRMMIPGFCYFMGVYIDSLATIRKTKNIPLMMHNGDSWNEPNGASAYEPSNTSALEDGYPTGTYTCLGLPEALSFETGFAHGSFAQGGTGEFNPGAGRSVSVEGLGTYSGTSTSAMWSDSRVNDAQTKFGPQYPIELDIGSANDGTSGGIMPTTLPPKQTYKDRVAARYAKTFARADTAGRDYKAISIGIQPLNWTTGDNSEWDLMDQGRHEATLQYPGKVLGSIHIGDMIHDATDAGPRSILCWQQFAPIFGFAYYIHLNISGNTTVAGWFADAIAKVQCPTDYLEKTRQA